MSLVAGVDWQWRRCRSAFAGTKHNYLILGEELSLLFFDGDIHLSSFIIPSSPSASLIGNIHPDVTSLLYEYAIRLEMKDAFFGCHESYRFPFPPFVLHLSPVLPEGGTVSFQDHR